GTPRGRGRADRRRRPTGLSRSSPGLAVDGEAVVITQGAPLVLSPEQAATLQLRDDVVDEQLQPAGVDVALDVEAVSGAVLEPLLHGIGDLRRRADDHPVGAVPLVDELPD